jgi:hypothetical protein
MPFWTPTQLGTAVKGWWKADAITSLNDGDAVASWADSSGNSQTLTEATNRPSYQTNELNGLPVVRFDGTNDTLGVTGTLGISAQPFTVAAVWNPAAANAGQVLFQTTGVVVWVEDTNADDLRVAASTNRDVSIASYNGAPFILLVSIEGASTVVRANGTVLSLPGSPGTTGMSGNMAVGNATAGGALGTQGDIAEILFTNTNPALTDKEKIEGYLAYKWGLQASLPSDHPYKSNAPQLPGHTGLRFCIGFGLRQRTLR